MCEDDRSVAGMIIKEELALQQLVLMALGEDRRVIKQVQEAAPPQLCGRRRQRHMNGRAGGCPASPPPTRSRLQGSPMVSSPRLWPPSPSVKGWTKPCAHAPDARRHPTCRAGGAPACAAGQRAGWGAQAAACQHRARGHHARGVERQGAPHAGFLPVLVPGGRSVAAALCEGRGSG